MQVFLLQIWQQETLFYSVWVIPFLFKGTTSSSDSIRWNFSDAGSGINNTSTLINPRHLFSGSGTYHVQLLKYLCGVADTTEKKITVTKFPVINNLSDTTVCAGTTVSLDATASPATAYIWNTGATTPIISSDSTGKYIVTVSNNGCISKDSMFLKEIISATAAVSISSNTSNSICEGSNILLTANPDASLPTYGISYQWYKNSNILSNDTIDSYSTAAINNGDIFEVVLTVDNTTTCLVGGNTATNAFPITVKPIPVMSAVPDQILCLGDNTLPVNFSSNLSSVNYNWTNNNILIGLGASGIGSIPVFQGENGGLISQTAVITVTPTKNGCDGGSQQFFYTVNQCALPVELLNFNGNKVADFTNNLYWSTASEFNSDYFILGYSQDAEQFSELYRVKAAGNSNQVRNYNFMHYDVPQGINFYRLKQVDLDGGYHYSDIVKIINKTEKYQANVYPNPATDNISILINNPVGNSLIQIYDALGQLMEQREIAENSNLITDINISQYANGMYYISISDTKNKNTIPVLKQ
jgi:hypothetical protein